jgi:hypothetical protein
MNIDNYNTSLKLPKKVKREFIIMNEGYRNEYGNFYDKNCEYIIYRYNFNGIVKHNKVFYVLVKSNSLETCDMFINKHKDFLRHIDEFNCKKRIFPFKSYILFKMKRYSNKTEYLTLSELKKMLI